MNRRTTLIAGLLLLAPGMVRADALPDGALRRLGTADFRLGPGEYAPVLAYSPDGKLLAVNHRDTAIRLLDARTGMEVRQLPGQANRPIRDLGFSPDGVIVVARYSSAARYTGPSSLYFWDLTPGHSRVVDVPKAAATINDHNYWQQLAVPVPPDAAWGFSPDSRFVATTDDGHTVHVLETSGWKQVGTFYSARVATALAVLAGGKRVAVGRDDGTIRVYDVASGLGRRELGRRGDNRILALALSPDGSRLAAALGAGAGQSARLWDLSDDRATPAKLDAGHAREVLFSRDGKTLTVKTTGNVYHVFEALSGKILNRFHLGKPAAVALSPDGKTLAWVEGRIIRQLDTATGKERPLAVGRAEAVWGLTFSHDGKRLTAHHESLQFICRLALEREPYLDNAVDYPSVICWLLWRTGNVLDASSMLDEDIENVKKALSPPFSYWRFRRVSIDQYLDDCRQLRRMIHGEPIRPMFLGPANLRTANQEP